MNREIQNQPFEVDLTRQFTEFLQIPLHGLCNYGVHVVTLIFVAAF